MSQEFLNGRVIIKIGDITREKRMRLLMRQIRHLLGGGGVDGAIHDAGGKADFRRMPGNSPRKIPERFADGRSRHNFGRKPGGKIS